ncbi:MAG: DEAD/DEAH box helicase [Actinobacteria bacterium]|nr:DEAD/DEAH box helicase [Actinomycetota bacterium]
MALILPLEKYDWPIRPEYTAFDHQYHTAKFLLSNKRAYVLNDLGTGKTLSTLWATDFLLRNQKIKKVLITCTLSTMQSVWADHIRKDLKTKSYVIAHSNKRSDRIAALRADVEYVIINHDGIKIILDEILEANFDVVVIDELTKFKSRTSDRSKAMKKIADKATAVWGLTGNPTPNRPTEAFFQAKVVNPYCQDLPRFFTKFRDKVEREVAPRIWEPIPDREDEVFKILQPAIRYLRDECIDIPEQFYLTDEVEMTSEQKKAYDDIKKELMHEYQQGEISASNAGVKIQKLLQVSAGWVKNDDGEVYELNSQPRLDRVHEIYEELRVKKLIVFSNFKASVEGVCKFLISKKINARFIHGDIDHKTRSNYFQRFQHGDIEVLVIQQETAAHGLTLTAASTIVWHSLTWSGDSYNQANGRISRIGQTEKQQVHNIVGSAAENKVLKSLTSKGARSMTLLEMFQEAVAS